MSELLYVGMIVYHKTNRTKAIIEVIEKDTINIALTINIAEKNSLSLPISHFGEWLFFDETDIDLPVERLIEDHRYLLFNNKRLKKFYNDKIKAEKEQERKEIEKKQLLISNFERRFSFDGFYHYTDFSNFIKIMRAKKLFSRSNAIEFDFLDSADKDVLDNTSPIVKTYVRFYYKENTPTFYRNEGIKIDNSSPHMPLPVALVFSKELITLPNAAFLSGCGGSRYSILSEDMDSVLTFDWGTIFSRGPIITEANSGHKYFVNKRNAEFLIPNSIDLKYLNRIIFRSLADLKTATILFGENRLFQLDEEKTKFNYNNGFLYDYNIKVQNGFVHVALNFYKDSISIDLNDYSHELLIIFEDGSVENAMIKNIYDYRIENDNEQEYYYFKYKPHTKRTIDSVEYYMNGHRCGIWEE